MDVLDKKIIYELDLNARAPVTRIAKKLRSSKETVNFRINKLMEQEYIKEFYTIFNAAKMAYKFYKLSMVFVDTTPDIEKKLISYVKESKNCLQLRICDGAHDLDFIIAVKELKDFKQFLFGIKNNFGKYFSTKDMHIIARTHKFGNHFLHNGAGTRRSFDNTDIGHYRADETDTAIMKALATNGRLKLVELAKMIKIESGVVKYRMKKLEQTGIIFAYSAMPNFDKLGLEFIEIMINMKSHSSIPNVIQFFYQTNKVIFIFEVLGRYDLCIELHVENKIVLRQILNNFKEKFGKEYNYYDVANVYENYVISWSPY
ncbi:MAG: Lrp/AsnC family transcriptional regulator [Candidatus Aenigmarchaeota archaeon]|nr:Lrp/AsnC family transcriptional regulator [Candidatus Aenigmarchaeota archaeon]